jgi:peptidoglycan/LPS O-acetylase OafA/YrhL
MTSPSPRPPPAPPGPPPPPQSTAPRTRHEDSSHLYAVDLYRVVTFSFVVAQHAVLFTAPTTSVSGQGVVFVLHFTREAFFMLTTFVLVHGYLGRPLAVQAFWRRRISLVALPYLAWTLIYVTILAVQRHSSSLAAVGLLAHYTVSGYYHLYFLVVTMQVYLLFPLLLKLLRRTIGHHRALFAVSAALQVVIELALHASDRPHAAGFAHAAAAVLLPSKSAFTYQFFVLTGGLAAWDPPAVEGWISTSAIRLFGGVAAVAALSIGWYAVAVASGELPSYAADVFQPVTVIWSLAAAAGMYGLGSWWARDRDSAGGRPFGRAVAWASEASLGIYLVHVVILRVAIGLLAELRIDESWPWPAKALLALAISLPASGAFVAAARGTALSRALTGRLRAVSPRVSS